jgi:glycosyltransferase involved in cell wall biosynthesis/cephalosporin hydroxylase
MNIVLCSERFLFRFGVDRVLIALAHGLKSRGHVISVVANRIDEDVVAEFAQSVVLVPSDGGAYIDQNESTAQWLEGNWNRVFVDPPDIAVIAGWPFISAIRVFRDRGVPTIYSDHGVVPLDGYPEGHRVVLEKLVDLRKNNLMAANTIVGVSDFIVQTQSRRDATEASRIETILNGADHMALALWEKGKVAAVENVYSNKVRSLLALSAKTILNLGRWEPGCYKNSDATFELIYKVRASIEDAVLLILADPQTTDIPEEIRDAVIPIGFPDDGELQSIMGDVDLGVSVSLWEGFNLPLAEMQWLGKPVLAFNRGAHKEVITDSWFLCESMEEMARKCIEILSGGGLEPTARVDSLDRFRRTFGWQRAVDQYEGLFRRVLAENEEARPEIYIDVTNATRDPANSGVIRVTRRLCRELQGACRTTFVVWERDARRYVYPTVSEYRQLSQFNGPIIDETYPRSADHARLPLDIARNGVLPKNPWLFLTETVLEIDGRYIRDSARALKFSIAAIFYDAIPIIRPDLVMDIVIRNNHEHYMRGLAECDLVIPISEFSGRSLRDFWVTNKLAGCPVRPNLLPGEFGGAPRVLAATLGSQREIGILCVSTLEPRKNHRRLIEAVRLFADANPSIAWTLTLIGNRYAGGDSIADFVQEACKQDRRIRWLGIVDDGRLHEAYLDSRFTVYASEIEGFGMPILESLWHGKPCICADQGVMAELAAEGGCLTTNVTNTQELAKAIETLALDVDIYDRLAAEATTRPIRNWADYSLDVVRKIRSAPAHFGKAQDTIQKTAETVREATKVNVGWQSALYSGCLTLDWQMNDSERLALAAILERTRPKCAIEVGTYRGGSLSLISQYVDVVFSIDIDPSIPGKLRHIANASFFTGPSQVIFPQLLRELAESGMPVEFVLIDGDHSARGVKRDVEILLTYVPTKPLVLMVHDGFNPECRRGLLEASWNSSPYVQYVDVDFIPGRIIEHGGGGDGEMWGGLAMAYFSPERRVGDVKIGQGSKRAFEEAKNRRAAQ